MSIIYYFITTHGGIPGYYDNNEFVPFKFEIPKELTFVNKITQAPLGIYNVGNEQTDMKIKNELSEHVEDYYNNRIFGNKLANEIGNLQSALEAKVQHTQNINKISPNMSKLDNAKLELYRHMGRQFHSVDNKQTNEFIDKQYSIDHKSDGAYRNIYVLFQQGGDLHKNDKILESIYDRKILRSTGIYGTTLSKLLDFSLSKGYKNVIIIDLSCESCYNIDTGKELDIQSRSIRQYRNESKRQKLWGGGKIKKRKSRKNKD
jgi:hypothetical protein